MNTTTNTLRTKLSDLRGKSALAWEGAVEAGHSDGGPGVAERAAMRAGLAHWDAALEAVESGDLEIAAEELESAQRRAAEYGDDQFERAALALIQREQNGPTEDQIRGLADESASAGDLRQVAIARRAIDELDTWETMLEQPACRIDDRAAVEAALAMTVEAARAECARVIADAAAQAEGGAQ